MDLLSCPTGRPTAEQAGGPDRVFASMVSSSSTLHSQTNIGTLMNTQLTSVKEAVHHDAEKMKHSMDKAKELIHHDVEKMHHGVENVMDAVRHEQDLMNE